MQYYILGFFVVVGVKEGNRLFINVTCIQWGGVLQDFSLRVKGEGKIQKCGRRGGTYQKKTYTYTKTTPTLVVRRGDSELGVLEGSAKVHARGDVQGVEAIHDEILNEEHQVTHGVTGIREGTRLQEEEVAVQQIVALAGGEVV